MSYDNPSKKPQQREEKKAHVISPHLTQRPFEALKDLRDYLAPNQKDIPND